MPAPDVPARPGEAASRLDVHRPDLSRPDGPPPDGPRLNMVGISKSFGGVKVLDDVALAVRPGEVVALLGANGAGKSTLMKVLTGVYTRDGGQIALDGSPAVFATPRHAARAGVSFLPQEISVIPEMSVAENICIGTLAASGALVARDRLRARATAVLAELGFAQIDPDALVGMLPVAEQRIVEIARALAGEARVLVMDEPTAALSEAESHLIFRILRRLKEKGTAVVYISHYLREVFEIADRIEVLRDGRNAGSFVTAQTDVPSVVAAMLGRVAGQLFDARPAPDAAAPVVFQVQGLSFRRALTDVSLSVRAGEVVGVFGLVGSGVEALGRVIFGAEGAPAQGSMQIGGAPYAATSPRAAKAAGIGFVTAERKKDGILADMTLRENLAAAFWTDYGRAPLTSVAAETANADAWIARLGIRTLGPEQDIRLLSGGNQQKACVARWLHPSVKLLILEEPTRGVDVGARRDIYTHLARFASQGLAVLVLSSDVEEIAGLCDRVLVMDRGRIAAEFGPGTDPSALMAATSAGQATEGLALT